MPFLMSDMAAGSTAVRTMQQNMIGSQYDAQNAAAAAEQVQEKVKQDKLKTEQEQLDVNRTRLSNIVTQSGIDLNNKTQEALEKVRNDPAYKTATEGEQARMVASALETANPEMAAKVRTSATAADLKDMQTKIQKQAEADDQLAKASGTIADATPEQVKNIIASWSPETKAQVKALIPNYQEEDPELLKKQLSKMMLNAKGQNSAMMMAEREKIQKMLDDSRERIARDRDIARIEARVNGRADKEDRADQRATQQIISQVQTDERMTAREVTKLHNATEEAKTKYRASGWFGVGKSGKEAYEAAYDAEMQARKDLATRNIARYETLPPGEFKNARLEAELDHLKIFDEPPADPEKETPKKASGKVTEPSKPAAEPNKATNNKPPVAAKSQEDFDTKWKSLKSGESLVGPDGKKYTKK